MKVRIGDTLTVIPKQQAKALALEVTIDGYLSFHSTKPVMNETMQKLMGKQVVVSHTRRAGTYLGITLKNSDFNWMPEMFMEYYTHNLGGIYD